MSSKAKKVAKTIVEQRVNTAVQVLTIMQMEAEKMSWWQRLSISWRFLWTKNIENFFELAKRNRKDEKVHNS